MTETRQESAAEYLRAAANVVRACATGNFDEAVANWLAFEAEKAKQSYVGKQGSRRHALAVAAAVLGRTWPS